MRLGWLLGVLLAVLARADDRCVQVEYATEHYRDCCAHGGFKLDAHRDVCAKIAPILKQRTAEAKTKTGL